MVRVGEVGYRTDGDKNWEFDKRSKHFSFGHHFVNSHNFFPCFAWSFLRLKGLYDHPGECSLNKSVVDCDLTTCAGVVYLQLWFILSAYLLSHQHKLIYKRNSWLPWQKYAARPGDVVRLLRTLGLLEWRHVLEMCSLYMQWKNRIVNWA